MADDTNKPVTYNRLNRALWFVMGVILFFWIGYEDRSTTGPIIVGGLIASLISFPVYDRLKRIRWITFQRRGLSRVLSGLTAGTLAMPMAALAMLVKVSLHSHVPPDFTSMQVLAVLTRTPSWAGAGLLIGFAASLWQRIRP